MSDQMIVRSYRRVFRIDRRIYRVDRWALPVPGGVPLRGVGYFAFALAAVLVLEALPVVGGAVGAVTAPLRYVVLPLAVAVLARAGVVPDGRPGAPVRARLARAAAARPRRPLGRAGACPWRVSGSAGPARARSTPTGAWRSVMTGLPLRMVHGNLLVGHGSARAALYRLDCVSYPFLSTGGQARRGCAAWRGWRTGWRRTSRCTGSRAPTRRTPTRRRRPGCSTRAGRTRRRGARCSRGMSRICGGCGRGRRRSISPSRWRRVRRPALGAGVIGGLDRARRRAEARARRRRRADPRRGARRAARARRSASCARVTGCVPAHRVTAAEVQWLLRRAACRGVCEPMLDEHWQPDCPAALRSSSGTSTRRCSRRTAAWSSTPRRRARYQAMLAVGALPEQTVFPGTAEILHDARSRASGFPADCVLHARRIDNRDALVRVRRRIVDADNAYAEQLASAHGPLSYVVEENRQLARELDAYLQATERPPLLNVAMSIAVGAELARASSSERVEELRTAFGTVALHRPLGLQAGAVPRPSARARTAARCATTPTC